MESDSLLSSIALTLSLVVFFFTSLVETSLTAPRLERLTNHLESQGLLAHAARYLGRRVSVYSETAVVLRIAATAAGTVAAVALTVALAGANWGAISIGALGLWVLLTVLRGGTRSLALRWNWLLLARLLPVILVVLWPFSPLGRAVARVRRPAHLASGQGVVSDGAEEAAALPIEAPQEELDPRERRMVRAILQLERTAVREIMVPRVDILAADVETPAARVTEMMMEGGHSRIPIYEETIDNIVGIAYARDLLGSLTRQQLITLRDVVRPVYFIPESKRVGELLEELQERRVHIALVVDEYGGVAGLVTIEDLLEEIVGEIADEFDVEESVVVQRVTEHEAVVDARVSLELVNETFSTTISGEGFDTLGGFVYSQLGRMPSPGDQVLSSGLKIEVLSTLGRRIKKIRITRTWPEQGDHQEQR